MRYFAFSALLLLASCGVHQQPPPHGKVAKLLIFSAPWCVSCLNEVPATIGHAKAKNVPVVVYIETGSTPSSHPTDADAAHYKETHHLDVSVVPDPWRWFTYRKYFDDGGYAVPTAAALDSSGASLQVFRSGTVSEDVRIFLETQ